MHREQCSDSQQPQSQKSYTEISTNKKPESKLKKNKNRKKNEETMSFSVKLGNPHIMVDFSFWLTFDSRLILQTTMDNLYTIQQIN